MEPIPVADTRKNARSEWAKNASEKALAAYLNKNELRTRVASIRGYWMQVNELEEEYKLIVEATNADTKRQRVLLKDARMRKILSRESSNAEILDELIQYLKHGHSRKTWPLVMRNPNLSEDQANKITFLIKVTPTNSRGRRLPLPKEFISKINPKMRYRFLKETKKLKGLLAENDKETFTALEKTWEGSLEELLNVCRELGESR